MTGSFIDGNDNCNLSNGVRSQVWGRAADSLKMNSVGSISSSAGLASAHDSGLAAIANGNEKLSEDAQQIANPDSPDVTGPLVELNQALVLAQAGANVISNQNKMLGALLDAFA